MARRFAPWLFRLGASVWPPYVGAGVRVKKIAADWREIVVEMPLLPTNRNYFGTHFGGSLYSMCDPFYSLMILHNLPPDYLVWDKAGSIDFVAPGRSRVRATFKLHDDDLAEIVRNTAGGDKHLHFFKTDIVDADGLVVARVEKIVYVRRKKAS